MNANTNNEAKLKNQVAAGGSNEQELVEANVGYAQGVEQGKIMLDTNNQTIGSDISNLSTQSVSPSCDPAQEEFFVLKELPDVARVGIQTGTFISCRLMQREKAEVKYKALCLMIELEGPSSTSRRYTVEKVYNLDKRGGSAFIRDYETWSGSTLTADQLAKFVPANLVLNKTARVNVAHNKVGSKITAVISEFLPPVASPGAN